MLTCFFSKGREELGVPFQSPASSGPLWEAESSVPGGRNGWGPSRTFGACWGHGGDL